MSYLWLVVLALVLVLLSLALKVVKQYERGVLFRLGRVIGGPAGGPDSDHPVRRRAEPGESADRHHADPVAGHHHEGQCHMSTIGGLGAFLAREAGAANAGAEPRGTVVGVVPPVNGAPRPAPTT